jgi:hypothetical protein
MAGHSSGPRVIRCQLLLLGLLAASIPISTCHAESDIATECTGERWDVLCVMSSTSVCVWGGGLARQPLAHHIQPGRFTVLQEGLVHSASSTACVGSSVELAVMLCLLEGGGTWAQQQQQQQ